VPNNNLNNNFLQKKLKAFSIIEVMVSIVISGIVISTAYSVYVFTYKQFFRFASVKTEIRNYFELSSVLTRDFETAKKVIKKGNQEVEIQLIDNQINYSFFNNHILRTINYHTDTFYFVVSDVEMNIINELKEEPLIDYLKLTLDDDAGDKFLSLHKNYGAILMIE